MVNYNIIESENKIKKERMFIMLKKLGIFTMGLILTLSLTACGRERIVEVLPQEVDNSTINDTNDYETIPVVVEDSANDIVEPEPESIEEEITIYYSNQEYIMTGDESLDIVIPVKKSVMVGEKPIEEIVVEELQKEPEDENLSTSLANLDIISVDTVENIAYVNISSEGLSGGSLTETLVLQQLVYSLTELDEVEAVQILVDGSKEVSLMGHITIEEPLTR